MPSASCSARDATAGCLRLAGVVSMCQFLKHNKVLEEMVLAGNR
jgi:hypothetical protein